MAIFDTYKTYFDVTDWRAQDSSIFERCTMVDWDDNIQWLSRYSTAISNGQTTFKEDSVQFESEYTGKINLGVRTYNMYNDVQLEQYFKDCLAKNIGGALTSTLVNSLMTSNKINNVDTIEDAFKKLGTQYLRRSSLLLVLPITSEIIDNNTGSYKGVRCVYSPYVTVTPRTEGNNYGMLIDLDSVWVAQYQDNKLRELIEESLVQGAKLWQYYYKFKFGIRDAGACAVFNVKR